LKRSQLWIGTWIASFAPTSHAFENTQVLPKGVRRIQLRQIAAEMQYREDEHRRGRPLGQPLSQSLGFDDVLGRAAMPERSMIQGLMLSEGINQSTAAGAFYSSVSGRVDATVPTLAYGWSDRWTIGIGIPYFRAATQSKVGFVPSEAAARLVDAMRRSGNSKGAAELSQRLNDAPAGLNRQLRDAGYEPLGEWSAAGIGDVNLLLKFLHHNRAASGLASRLSIIAPTGRADDPNHLADVPFGDGVWSGQYATIFDWKLASNWVWNWTLGATVRGSADQPRRFRSSPNEKLPSLLLQSTVEAGDGVIADTSLQWESVSGLTLAGGVYGERNFSTRIRTDEGLTDSLPGNENLVSQWSLGWSSVGQYLRGQAMAPLAMSMNVTEPIEGRNLVATRRFEVEARMFF
jgi:hypothetical protein